MGLIKSWPLDNAYYIQRYVIKDTEWEILRVKH